MSYGIIFGFNNYEETFQIPVNPLEQIQFQESGSGEVMEIASLGEINIIKSPALMEVSFKSVFPKYYAPYVTVAENKLLNPVEYVAYFEKWLLTKRPIRFDYFTDDFSISKAVSIEDFTWTEKAGSPGDIEYSLSLKEYVFYAPKKVVIKKNTKTNKTTVTKKSTRPNEKVRPKTVTVKAGDTLWVLAKKHLGDGSRSTEIQKLNGLTNAQVKHLQIGTVLKLPEG